MMQVFRFAVCLVRCLLGAGTSRLKSFFLRTDDIPILTAEGAIDLGITGADLVAEAGVDLIERLSLWCR